jgi:hypothetical protein
MNPDPTSLQRLHNIVVPPPVPWWPPAPGWYWLMAFGTVILLLLALRIFIWWQHNRYRREALAELARQEPALCDPATRTAALATIAELLKRAALSAFPRAEVASLTGPVWFEFLDRTGRTLGFSQSVGPLLEGMVYDPRLAESVDETKAREIAVLARHWLAHHRVENSSGQSP